MHRDYYHGNPEVYEAHVYNAKVKRTMGDLYQRTMDKEECVRNLGYNLISVWEKEWNTALSYGARAATELMGCSDEESAVTLAAFACLRS